MDRDREVEINSSGFNLKMPIHIQQGNIGLKGKLKKNNFIRSMQKNSLNNSQEQIKQMHEGLVPIGYKMRGF